MIKKYREKRKYTQEELAEIMNISARQMQRIENGENEITLKNFKKLVKILKIEDKDILDFIKN